MTGRTPKLLGLAMLLAVVAVIAACSAAPQASPTQRVCDGISEDMGGCTAERHDFTSSTCADLAREWATVFDEAIVGILNGRDAGGDQAPSSLIRQALVITTVDMNSRMRELGLRADCDLPEFMAAAEPLFSAELRAGVGSALYDDKPPATYEEWLDDVRRVVRVIDDEE